MYTCIHRYPSDTHFGIHIPPPPPPPPPSPHKNGKTDYF